MGKKKDWFTSSAMALNMAFAAQSVYWHQGNGLLETVIFWMSISIIVLSILILGMEIYTNLPGKMESK